MRFADEGDQVAVRGPQFEGAPQNRHRLGDALQIDQREVECARREHGLGAEAFEAAAQHGQRLIGLAERPRRLKISPR